MNWEPAHSDRIEPHVWRIASVMILGMIMTILDTTIVNVALDTLGRDLHSTIGQIQWIVTGYLLALAAVIPVSGWAARRFGAKRVYVISIVLFTAGSALCGLATTTTSLVLFRVLQGVGGGMTMPIGQMIVAHVAGPQRMGRVMGVIAMPAMLAPVFGPLIGGAILEGFHWSWIFYVNVPIGIVAVVLSIWTVPHIDLGRPGRLDVLGLGLLATSMPLLIYGLSEISTKGSFTAPTVVGPILGGLLLSALFVMHAKRVRRPVLDIRLYANRVFAAASGATFFVAAALFGSMILLPLYFQQVRHESVILTGLLVAPQGIGAAIAMPFAGRLSDRLGGGRVAIVGVTVVCLATIPFGLVGANTSILALSVAQLVRGVGVGMSFMPAMTSAYAALRRDQLSDATPQMNVLQRIGGAIGTAVLAVVLQRAALGRPHSSPALAAAFGTTFWWGLGIAALALVPCVVLLLAERSHSRARKLGSTAEAIGA
jgi:EmrB/QacA subfamily drug resistance transporter